MVKSKKVEVSKVEVSKVEEVKEVKEATLKPKRALSMWTSFCKSYYESNKAKFSSFKSMLQSAELKQAYADHKNPKPVVGGKHKK